MRANNNNDVDCGGDNVLLVTKRYLIVDLQC